MADIYAELEGKYQDVVSYLEAASARIDDLERVCRDQAMMLREGRHKQKCR